MEKIMTRRRRLLFSLIAGLVLGVPALATVFGTVRGVIHDPSHRPIAGAEVVLQATGSSYSQTGRTSESGEFEFAAVPIGEYKLQVRHSGFGDTEQPMVVISGTAP